jgi:enoyl-CoA hydratase
VEGAAVGIGLLIATSADILVISRSARLRMPEVMLGIDVDVAPLRRFLPDSWIRRMCLVGETFTATDMRLDYCAGATLCEAGTTEQAAAAVFESLAGIEASFLERAKRRLTESLFNGHVDKRLSLAISCIGAA